MDEFDGLATTKTEPKGKRDLAPPYDEIARLLEEEARDAAAEPAEREAA